MRSGPQSIPFIKMQGLGNDFIVIDGLGQFSGLINSEISRKICDRRLGVGADQVLWIRPAQDLKADARMEIFNADGSIAEMCGNGIRAVALYLNQAHKNIQFNYQIETLAGVIEVKVQSDNPADPQVCVNMGVPSTGIDQGEEIQIQGKKYRFFEVSMGNPHAVFFVDSVDSFPLEQFGPEVENHPRFPNRTNVEVVQVLNPEMIQVRVWERGAGMTLACGTGACAAAAASILGNQVSHELKVLLPGGTLQVKWNGKNQPLYMTGPARWVFQGEISGDLFN